MLIRFLRLGYLQAKLRTYDVKTGQTDWRERLVLEAFEGRELLHNHDLPNGVNRRTMAKLLERNVVRVVEVKDGTYAKDFAWRLIH